MSITAVDLHHAVAQRLERLAEADAIGRIWQKDATLWTDDPNTPELADRLGWLTASQQMVGQIEDLTAFAADVRQGFDRIILLGMGGSSLAPEVLWRTFGPQADSPPFTVLDSTHPAAVEAATAGAEVDSTLFIVSSKSGTTVETMSFYRYFWDRTGGNGAQFVAITDSGTPLDELGKTQGFRKVFHNPADIGGRYSALSLFGLVPAALMGIDVGRLLERGEAMARSCAESSKLQDNPGAWLGALMGEAAVAGRSRLTFAPSLRFDAFGPWVEQLVAESTGKAGKGILPVLNEPIEAAGTYGGDRLFVAITQAGTRESGTQLQFRALEEADHPLIRIGLEDRYELGGEFFRWEFATAITGMILHVNPFDQPNVVESKRITSRLLAGGVRGDVPASAARAELERFLDDVAPGHYLAIMAYLPPSSAKLQRLYAIQAALRDRLGAAVTVGYGPRLLHSTGQLHKGGPPTGHFVQVLEPGGADLAIPDAAYTFGDLIAAQALGDYQALHRQGRPVIRVQGLDLLEGVE